MNRRLVNIFLKWVTIGFIIGFMLPGCSPQERALRKIRRAERLAPELFKQTITTDTVFIPVEPLIVKDTVIRDSLIVRRDTVTDVVIRYRISQDCDTIEIEADCPDNEVITVEKEKIIKVRDPWYKRLLPWFILGLVVALFILRASKK